MADKRVLAVGIERDALESVPDGLIGEAFELDRAPTPRSAMDIMENVRFDLVVIGHPQEGLQLRPFLRWLRDTKCASTAAKAIVLADDPHHHELVDLRMHAVEVVAKSEALIGDLSSKVLGGAPRVQMSLLVRLEIDLPYGHSIRICQSENLSESGMLVRTEDSVPVGTTGLVSFQLPATDGVTKARVRVVRETMPGEIPGIALAFEDFQKDSQRRLRAYLSGRLSR